MDYVLVTTKHRGVFAGTLKEERDRGRTVVLSDCRCAIRWNTTHGFLELAQRGPNDKSFIGSTAPEVVLYDVTSVAKCSPEAEEAWKRHE